MASTAEDTTTVVVATAYGGPEVLSVIEAPLGPVGPDEVLIDVRAVGTNPVDYKRYSGDAGVDPAALPMRLGFEVAGVVSEVGGNAAGPSGSPIRVGDEVIAFRIAGAYAARVVVPASTVVPKPSTLSFEQASGLMLAGTTAVHALTVARVGADDTVLVHGAAGGVGLMVVQLAVAAGARVIGTASEGNHAFLRELGAEPVVYGRGLRERVRALAPERVDAVVDAAGGDEALGTSLAMVAERDRIIILVASPRAFEAGTTVIGGAPGADPGTDLRAAARLTVAQLAGDGKLRVVVAGTHPLVESAAVHRALKAGHTRGKIVLIP